MAFGNPQASTNFNIPEGEGKTFEKPMPGPHPGIVTGVYYLGNIMVKSSYGDAFKPRLMLEITLETRDSEGNHFVMCEEFTASCYGSAILGKFLSGLGGQPISEDFNNYMAVLWTQGMFNYALDSTGKYLNCLNAMPYQNQLNIDVVSIQNDRTKATSIDMGVSDIQSFAGMSRRVQRRAMKSQEYNINYDSQLQQGNPQLWDDLNKKNDDNKQRQQGQQQQGFQGQQQNNGGFSHNNQAQGQQNNQGYQQQQPQQQQQGFQGQPAQQGQTQFEQPQQQMQGGGMQQAQQQAQQPSPQQMQNQSQQFQNPNGQTVQQTMNTQGQAGQMGQQGQQGQAMQGQVMERPAPMSGPDDFDDDIPF